MKERTMGDNEEILKILSAELGKQKAIFRKNSSRVINPDNTPEYDAAKTAFDTADRRIKELEQEIARLVTGGEPHEPTIFDKMFDYIDKLTGDDDDHGRDADIGVRG